MKMNYLLFITGFLGCLFSGIAKADTPDIRLYVSVSGNDENPGTVKKPLASLNRAIYRLRELRKQQNYPGNAEIIVEGGEYFLREPVLLESGDSGNEKGRTIISAAKGQKPVFTGSIPLKNWVILNDSQWLNKLDAALKGKIYVINLKEEGISDFGDPTNLGERPDLICNGMVQTLARWPNEGYTKAGLVRGKTELPPTYIKKRGTKEGEFEYLDDRQSRWVNEPDARLGGYWYWDWSEQYQKIERIDTRDKTIFVREPWHNYGYRDSLRYFGLNILSETDRPGEWYLDRDSGLLFWYPPEGIVPGSATISFTVFNAPFMIEASDCSAVTIQGLTLCEGRGSAIRIKGGESCLLKDCLIERFGSDGIHVEGGRHHCISGCLLNTLGCSGIRMEGGDRKNLIPANHCIEQTIVEHFSIFKRTYQPAVHLTGCGIIITNNRFSDSSSSAMRLEGNDFLIQYNEIDHVVNESDDQGGIDLFYNPSYQGIVIKNNRWSDITGGTRHGAAGVRLDDMISGVTIYGNLFERCGARDFGAVQIHGGKGNLVENNLFYDCNAAVSFSTWTGERWLKELESPQIRKKIYEDVDIRSAIYQKKYPLLKDLRDNPNVNTVENNLVVGCKNLYLRKNSKLIESNNTSLPKTGNVEYFCSKRVLLKYGLHQIPVRGIGPLKNKIRRNL